VILPDQFRGKKILVTGASGFIGTHLCRRLCEADVEVHGISRIERSDKEKSVQWWQGDLARQKRVRQLLKAIRPDVIFHLAGHVTGVRDLEAVIPSFRNNLLTTVNLLTEASEIGCRRFVFAGSMEEPDLSNPHVVAVSPYSAAKWATSAYCRMFHALFQLPVVILRVFMVYGPGQHDLRKLIPYVILCLLRKEAPKLTSGQRPIDWIYVEDVVEGFLAAAQSPGMEGETIDIGSGVLVTIQTVIDHLVRLMGAETKACFGTLPERPFERVCAADVAKSNTMIGWNPKISLVEGLQRTVNWYERQLEEGALPTKYPNVNRSCARHKRGGSK